MKKIEKVQRYSEILKRAIEKKNNEELNKFLTMFEQMLAEVRERVQNAPPQEKDQKNRTLFMVIIMQQLLRWGWAIPVPVLCPCIDGSTFVPG